MDEPRARPRGPHDRRGERLAEVRAGAARRRPADLLAQWTKDSTVQPSPMDLRTSVALDALALAAAPGYDALLLSPVAPNDGRNRFVASAIGVQLLPLLGTG